MTQGFELPSTSYAPNEGVESENASVEFGEVEEQVEQDFDEEESSHKDGEVYDMSRHSIRERRTPTYLKNFVDPSTLQTLIAEEEPYTFQEAINTTDANHWKEAMEEEMMALHKNQTWD